MLNRAPNVRPGSDGGGATSSVYTGATSDVHTHYYEVRASGPKREQFRLFCLLENADSAEPARRGLKRPAIAVITGMRKPWRTAFGKRDYAAVRRIGDQHLACYPRRVAE